METFVDLKILGSYDEDAYVIAISKEDLSQLVRFNEELVIRHWDGNKPVVLENYGDTAVRTREDGSEANNLASLPRVKSVVISG